MIDAIFCITALILFYCTRSRNYSFINAVIAIYFLSNILTYAIASGLNIWEISYPYVFLYRALKDLFFILLISKFVQKTTWYFLVTLAFSEFYNFLALLESFFSSSVFYNNYTKIMVIVCIGQLSIMFMGTNYYVRILRSCSNYLRVFNSRKFYKNLQKN